MVSYQYKSLPKEEAGIPSKEERDNCNIAKIIYGLQNGPDSIVALKKRTEYDLEKRKHNHSK